jgi:hypothetical protein
MASPDERGLRTLLRAALSPALHLLRHLHATGTPPSEAVQRPDVAGLLGQGLQDGQQAAEEATEAAWRASGAPMDSETLQQLLRDTQEIFSRAWWAVVHELSHSGTLPDNAEELAAAATLHSGMSVSTALSAGRTEAVLAEGYRRRAAGERVLKRWRSARKPTTCRWCWDLDGVTLELEDEFDHGVPQVLSHAHLRHVRTDAGARHFGAPVGSPIIRTRPPRVWHGILLGPPRHPRCECWLELVTADQPSLVPPTLAQRAMEGELVHSADIRTMPEEQYGSMMTFLRAAVHELGQLLRRVTGRG